VLSPSAVIKTLANRVNGVEHGAGRWFFYIFIPAPL